MFRRAAGPAQKKIEVSGNDIAVTSTLRLPTAVGICKKPEPTRRAIITNFDMPKEMLYYATETANEALKSYTCKEDVAAHVKRAFDEKYGPSWHCVAGRDFSRYVAAPLFASL